MRKYGKLMIFSFILNIILLTAIFFTISNKNNVVDRIICKTSFEDQILREAQIVATSHSYSVNNYDCTNFSIDLRGNLSITGFNTKCAFGYLMKEEKYVYDEGLRNSTYLNKTPHTWVIVEIPIDAVSGEYINKETYDKEYKLVSIGEKCL